MQFIGIITAMQEEAKALDFLKSPKEVTNLPNISEYDFNNIKILHIISGIGKANSAMAASLLINKYNCQGIINVGSCGGINKINIGEIIISNTTGYTDVDVTAFKYKLGQIPNMPHFFKGNSHIFHINNIIKANKNVKEGFIATADSFINNKAKVKEINNIYPNILGLEMEAASIAQICHIFNKDFLLIKKVSDLADSNASESFSKEINNMEKNTQEILKNILTQIDNNYA